MNPRNDFQESALEEALRRALRSVDPPAGFAHRVLERTVIPRRKRLMRGWLAVAAMLLLGGLLTTALLDYHARQVERESAERQAGHDLVVALRIAGHKVHVTHQMIRRRNGAGNNGATHGV
jgi:hypothetical protein